MRLITPLTAVTGQQMSAATLWGAHTVTVDIPVGPRYHALWIHGRAGLWAGVGKVMTDLVGEIRVKLNGRVQRVYTADELNKLNALNGPQYSAVGGMTVSTVSASVGFFSLPIFFGEPWRQSLAAQTGTAWATGGKSVSSFQLEIDVKASSGAITGPAIPLTFTADYEESFYLPNGSEVAAGDVPIGYINKVYNVSIPTVAASSAFGDFMGLPKTEPISQISLVDAAVAFEFELKINNAVFRADTRLGNEARLIAAGMVPNPTATATPYQTSTDVGLTRAMVDIVPDHDDLLTSIVPVVLNGRPINSLNLRIKQATATSVKCLYQTVGKPD